MIEYGDSLEFKGPDVYLIVALQEDDHRIGYWMYFPEPWNFQTIAIHRNWLRKKVFDEFDAGQPEVAGSG